MAAKRPGDADAVRERLLTLQAELRAEGKVAFEPNRPGGSSLDEDAQALNEMNQAISSARNRDRVRRLEAIAAALQRLAQDPDEVGTCEDCESDIPGRRMELMPWVTLCVRCQEAREAEPGGGGRPTRRKLTDFV